VTIVFPVAERPCEPSPGFEKPGQKRIHCQSRQRRLSSPISFNRRCRDWDDYEPHPAFQSRARVNRRCRGCGSVVIFNSLWPL